MLIISVSLTKILVEFIQCLRQAECFTITELFEELWILQKNSDLDGEEQIIEFGF